MPIENPSFEDAGQLPGAAKAWRITTVTSLAAIAGFGTTPEEAWEGFERWFERWASLGDVPTVLASFAPNRESHDGFERGWRNDLYFHELPPAQLVPCPFGDANVEDMERGWQNVPYARDWQDVRGVVGIFDGESSENFEDGWRSNESYAWTWQMVTGVAAPVESFESGWTPLGQEV